MFDVVAITGRANAAMFESACTSTREHYDVLAGGSYSFPLFQNKCLKFVLKFKIL